MARTLLTIAGVTGLISLFLGFILPDIGAWFRFEASADGATLLKYYINGLGYEIIRGSIAQSLSGLGSGIKMMEFLGGLCSLIGCILCLIGGARESKEYSITGAILILFGPILLIFDVLVLSSGNFNLILLIFGATDQSFLFGGLTIMGNTLAWGLWIGSFLALGAGVLGILGVITLLK